MFMDKKIQNYYIRIAYIIMEKNKNGGLTLPYLKTYYKATVIEIVWTCERMDK